MTAAEKRAKAVQLIKSRAKKNSYTQGANRDYVFGKPEGAERGYGDCSSTVMHVLKRAAGINIGGNTSTQWSNAKAGKGGAKIVDRPNGQYFDESKLRPGDCLYFRGNSAHVDSVGHVEMYTGKNQCVGHGSGTGPTVKNLKSYCGSRTGSRRALGAVRWILEDATPPEPAPKLGDRALSYGMDAPDVGELQTLLVQLGHNLGDYGPKKNGVDCEYGAKTRDAVSSEQAAANLPRTGDADLVTIRHIIAAATGKPRPQPLQHVRIVGGDANIRSGPSTKHKIVGLARLGSLHEAGTSAAEGWHAILHGDTEAWVSAKYSEVVD